MMDRKLPECIRAYALDPDRMIAHLYNELMNKAPSVPRSLYPIAPRTSRMNEFRSVIRDTLGNTVYDELMLGYTNEYDFDSDSDDNSEPRNFQKDGAKVPKLSDDLCVRVFEDQNDSGKTLEDNMIVTSLSPDQKNALLNISDGIKEFMWSLGLCNPGNYVKEMKAHAPPPCVCCRILKKGDQGYKCRDCELDESACICLNCFDPEKHVGHNYYIVDINNGCCDCGDSCAWKPSGFCNKHRQISPEEDLTLLVPEQFRASTRTALTALLRALAAETIRKDDPKKDLKIFSFLAPLLLLTKELGYGFARMVALAMNEKFDFGSRSKLCRDSPAYNTPLWFIVKNSVYLCGKNEELLKELLFTLIVDPYFKSAFAYVFCLQYEHLALASFVLYKTQRLTDKENVGVNVDSDNDTWENDLDVMRTPNYFLWDRNRGDDDDDDENKISKKIMSFSVQLLSSKGSVSNVIEKTDFIRRACATLYHEWKRTINQATGLYQPTNTAERLTSLSFRCAFDISYLPQQYNGEPFIFDFSRGMKHILDLLTPLQDAGNTVMKTGMHISYESGALFPLINFQVAFFNLLMHYITALKRVSNPSVRLQMAKGVLGSIWSVLQARFLINGPALTEHLEDGTDVIAYDITGPQGATIINPLGTYASAFLCDALADKELGIDSAEDIQHLLLPLGVSTVEFAKYLLEWPLRVMALIAQISAGHWVRNGENLQYLARQHRYRSYIKGSFFYVELVGVQACAAVLPKDLFAATFLSRFGLYGATGGRALRERQKVRELVVYEALRDLLEIALGTQYAPRADPVEACRYHMIQMLAALGHFGYSEGRGACEALCSEYFDKVLDTVCTKDGSSRWYSLKDECWADVNPYYIYLDLNKLGVLEDHFGEYAKRVSKPAIFECPRVRSYTHPLFKHLPAVLGTRAVHSLIARLICGEFCEDKNPVSSRALVAALHIMLLSLTDRRVCTEAEVRDVVAKEALAGGAVTALCTMVKNENKASPLIITVLRRLTQVSTECMDICASILGSMVVEEKMSTTTLLSCSADDVTKLKEEERKRRAKLKQKSIMGKLLKKQENAFKSSEAITNAQPVSNGASNGKEDKEGKKEEKSGVHKEEEEKEEKSEEETCIICHTGGGILGYVGYVQRSNFLNSATARSNGGESLSFGGFTTPMHVGKADDYLLNFMIAGLDSSAHAQSCRHVIHLSCIFEYSRSKDVFYCPCCRKLSNTFIPMVGGPFWPKTGNFFAAVTSNVMALRSRIDSNYGNLSILDTARCASYTLASYEYAARSIRHSKESATPSLATYMESTPRSIPKELFYCVVNMGDEDRSKYKKELVPLLLGSSSEYKSFILPIFETFNVLLLGFAFVEDSKFDNPEEQNVAVVASVDKETQRKKMVTKLFGVDMFRAFAALKESGSGDKANITVGTVLKYCVPFLRRAALLLSVVEEGKSLAEIRECDTDPYALAKFCGVGLDLPAPDTKVADLLAKEVELQRMFSVWDSKLPNVPDVLGFSVAPCVPFKINVLEKDFVKALTDARATKCRKCGTFPEFPATCLVCGQFLCPLGKCCASPKVSGECNEHISHTTAGFGVFIIWNRNYVMFLSSRDSKGAICHSPYVDDHGELDMGFNRGKPMHLDMERLAMLEREILEYEADGLCSMDTTLHMTSHPNWNEF